MLYTMVLAIDLFIIGLERYGKETWVKFFRDIYLVLVVAGVILSTLHQSSLGALYLLLPEKMRPSSPAASSSSTWAPATSPSTNRNWKGRVN
jgi:hypothetical protein